MGRYGITGSKTLGVRVPVLRQLAREYKPNHALAEALWTIELRETRVLASMVADPAKTTPELMDAWITGFTNWEVCDQCCMNLFRETPHAWTKVTEWSTREPEFEKRAAFALLATVVVRDKHASDAKVAGYLPLVQAHAGDDRKYVKKSVDWALRQIGKRNRALNVEAIIVARALCEDLAPAARWIGHHALKELTSEKVQARLKG